MSRFLLLLIITFSISACSSSAVKDKEISHNDSLSSKETVEKGKVIDTITCKNNPNHSFSIYLPSSYSSEKTYPIVFALDPHGEGKLPVSNYKELAEKYNYILVGSNNSQNGKSWEESNQLVNSLIADVKNRFSINTSRIYLLGFSGGARIANTIAMSNGEIEAVICCGAVSPATTIYNTRSNYSLVCITGTADFNYTEIVKYEKVEGYKLKHTLIKFEGKHEWPPLTSMDDAFWFLELNEMRRTPGYKKETVINEIIEKENKELNDLLSANNHYEAFLKCKKTINYYNGLNDLKKFFKAYQNFKTNKEIDTILRIEEAFWKLEEEEKQRLMQALQTKNADWWKTEVANLNKKINSSKKQEEVNMNKRLLGFLSMITYMQTSGKLKENDIKTAEHFCSIYILVDPTNNEAHYLDTEINAANGKTKEAIQSLNEAVKYGFKDLKRLESDNMLNSIKNEEEFIGIVEKLK